MEENKAEKANEKELYYMPTDGEVKVPRWLVGIISTAGAAGIIGTITTNIAVWRAVTEFSTRVEYLERGADNHSEQISDIESNYVTKESMDIYQSRVAEYRTTDRQQIIEKSEDLRELIEATKELMLERSERNSKDIQSIKDWQNTVNQKLFELESMLLRTSPPSASIPDIPSILPQSEDKDGSIN